MFVEFANIFFSEKLQKWSIHICDVAGQIQALVAAYHLPQIKF